MGNIKIAAFGLIMLALFAYLLSFPLYVSVSFDVERDPPAINYGDTSFEGIEKIPDILDIMDAHGARGTFFVTGRVAGQFPGMVEIVNARGHEVGAHGGFYHEEAVAGLSKEEQIAKILQTKNSIENVTGASVVGYRAPGHLIDSSTLIALEELGFLYDSSVVPSVGGSVMYKHSILSPDAPYHPSPHDPFLKGDMEILEIPITPVFMDGNLDSLMAYQGMTLTRVELAISAIKCKIRGTPMVLYLHPGMLADLPNEPSNYRSGEHLVGQFDESLAFLDVLGARYVALEEINSL
jgi:peptidoglycan/xylan/chitin deacetylase (PgdA/CDA1 family)